MAIPDTWDCDIKPTGSTDVLFCMNFGSIKQNKKTIIPKSHVHATENPKKG